MLAQTHCTLSTWRGRLGADEETLRCERLLKETSAEGQGIKEAERG